MTFQQRIQLHIAKNPARTQSLARSIKLVENKDHAVPYLEGMQVSPVLKHIFSNHAFYRGVNK